jgi:RNA polymerase sigma-70 factor (ECF subfamily)
MANAVAQAELVFDPTTLKGDEEDLIAACKRGNEQAFQNLYLAHRSEAYRVVYRLLGPTSELDDVVQEVFLQVHRSLHNFRGQAKFSTWLHRVAVNVALQHLRRKRTTPASHHDERLEERPASPSCDSPHQHAETQDRLKAVYRLLDQLSAKKRAVLVMHDMQGMSAEKIAAVVGAPVFTVRTRLFYARREFYRRIATDPAFAGDLAPGELCRK